MAFTEEQKAAIDAKGRVIVSASAGSGKTTVMIQKIINLITSGTKVEEVLAVTFTKKAAAQMKEKLAKALIEEINKKETTKENRATLKKQLAGVPSADISTIHSFCSKLIKSHFFLAGVDNSFRVIGGEDADGRSLKNQALDELLEEGYEESEGDFQVLLDTYWRKKKDDALRKIFDKCYLNLRDRADYRAYLEKMTRGYTEADFDGVCADLLALTKEKLQYYYDMLKAERDAFMAMGVGAKNQFALCNELMEWLGLCLQSEDYFFISKLTKPPFTQNRTSKKTETEDILAGKARLGFLKERIVKGYEKEFGALASREEELARFLQSGETAKIVAKYLLVFDEKYARLKRERGVLDYNDLEHIALALLKNPEIAKEMQEKYSYVFVDEYQDVNPVQEEIISLLAKDNLFLVGDVKQSIYGFRGSQSRYFVETQDRLSKGGGQSLFMKYNFRSMDKVLDAVNLQFNLAMTKSVCDVDYHSDGWMNRGGKYETNSGSVRVHFVPETDGDEQDRGVYSVKEAARMEAESITDEALAIKRIIDEEVRGGAKLADIAILSRKKSGEIERQVAALSALGVPITTASSVNICEFSEVKALIDILSLLDNREQDIPLCSALLSAMGNCTVNELTEIRLAYPTARNFRTACWLYQKEKEDELAEKLRAFYGYYRTLRTQACVLSVGEILTKLLADTKMEAGLLARRSGVAGLKRIRRFIEEATAFEGSSLHEFLEHLRNLDYDIPYSENGGENSVKVMTMHSSKGLEFPVVILPNLNQAFRSGDPLDVYVEEKYGLAPRAFDTEKMLRYPTLLRRLFEAKEGRSARSDELNLYYVALTRAERSLHLIFSERVPIADVKYARSFAEFTNFDVWERYVVEENPDPTEQDRSKDVLPVADEGAVQKIIEASNFTYAHNASELPVKNSATSLMEMGAAQEETHYGALKATEEKEKSVSAIDEGTAYHLFLERFHFALLLEGGESLSKEVLSSLVDEHLQAISWGAVKPDREKLVEILSNPVFYELSDMRLYKEQKFLVSLPARLVKTVYGESEGVAPALLNTDDDEEMIFQGAIDLLARGDGEARIIDYKYSGRSAQELRSHYAPQLNLYRLAVSKIEGIPVEKIRCTIVNIRLGFQIDIE